MIYGRQRMIVGGQKMMDTVLENPQQQE